MKTTSCTEDTCYVFNLAPRCGARTKRNNGSPCRSPAVRGKTRCRIHGGSTRSGGQLGNTNALKHGGTTIETKIFKKVAKELMKSSYALMNML